MFEFFSCVAAAVAAAAAVVQNVRDVLGAGKKVYDLAADIVQRWNGKAPAEQRQALLRKALAQAAQAPPEQFDKEMRQVVANAAGNQPAEAQDAIVQYLNLIPQRIQQNFARQEDPTGTTVPVTWSAQQPEDLLPLLPPRLPRFRAGDSPPNTRNWVLTRRLGLGGFGEVWQAKHTLLKDRHAAFKFCLDPASQKRLIEHEAEVINQVMTQLEHPNIVKLLEVDFNDAAPWLQYEYVPGGELGQLAASWPTDPARRARLATDAILTLARTAAFCHQLTPAVVHRDFKPSNVLLGRDPFGKPCLKITDFGISDTLARQALDEAARRVTVGNYSCSTPSLVLRAHTPLYASPQQKEGIEAPHPADDVHALGVMWYQLLLGNTNRALGADFYHELVERHFREELIDVLSHCIAGTLDRRYPNAAVMAEQIQRLPADLLAKPADKSVLFDQQLDALFEDADQKKAKARELINHRRYEDAKKLLETIRHRKLRESEEYTLAVQVCEGKRFVNSIGMAFAFVPHGTFWMGGGKGRCGNQQVAIPHSFYLGVYQVTQEEWQAVMGNNPSCFQRNGGSMNEVIGIPDSELKRFPVEGVSWNNAQKFINKLNNREKNSEWLYRLPREAEWEYACRTGATSQEDCTWHFYLDQPSNDISPQQANFGNSLGRTTKVGSYKPNCLGIYDLHGNVWEWCEDALDFARVIRGGAFNSPAKHCRAAYREGHEPTIESCEYGLRLARVPVR